MNTSTVARKLGVSPSTVGRWVRQLNLQIDRNEYGHFLFSESDVQVLKKHQQEVQQLSDDQLSKKNKRLGTAKSNVNEKEWLKQIESLERKIDSKADRVVSYQLLQHRQEIESIQKELAQLQEKIIELSALLTKEVKEETIETETKKKTPIRAFFRL